MAKTRSQTLADRRQEEREALLNAQRRRQSLRSSSSKTVQPFQAHEPVIIRPINSRHVRWIERELISNAWDKIWTRKFPEAVNDVHDLLIEKWPQYAFTDRGDAELAQKLSYLRKEASVVVFCLSHWF
ncbi:hypothetical protein VNI00_013495 [Paramarasmius palmivorus]|uniref:Uncharacterized protein n=1 Tax=Paramarasmius palmivorus TaxID=297713 RepID=A0AAW0BV06_9AGAR